MNGPCSNVRYATGSSELATKRLKFEAVKILREFLTPKTAIGSEVYETPDCHFEHDIVAVDEGLCLVIEAKAAQMDGPRIGISALFF